MTPERGALYRVTFNDQGTSRRIYVVGPFPSEDAFRAIREWTLLEWPHADAESLSVTRTRPDTLYLPNVWKEDAR